MVKMSVTVKDKAKKNIGFAEVNKTPKTKKIKDYKLTLYACHLIVMNGDRAKKLSLWVKPIPP
jgi:hypothetical protein